MPTARQIHTDLEKIKCDLDTLRVKLWNQMAEEERWPKPKVSTWIVFYYHEESGEERIAGVFSDSAVAQATYNTLQDMDYNPEMGEYTLDQVYPPTT